MTNNRITNKKLSIVITFCNEGREVKETLESLRVSSDERLVDILLVNDASDDKFDYNHIASKYNASIYTNKKRKGVAESRNIGVSLSRTPYIIILDAHMRIYQTDWADIILHLLSMYPRTLFCCQTLPINKVGEIISSTPTSFGAYIDMQTMGAKWNKVDLSLKDYIYDIPCLLGASYAFSRNYWLEIHGCDGLKSYGYDEQLISLKSWLYGEGCSLIKTISFGHMFRDKTDVPYSLSELDYTYNKLLLICLFLGKKILHVK